MPQPPDPRPILECELVVVFDGPDISHGLMRDQSQVTQEHLREHCAEVNIPVHTEDAMYCFVCFLGHLPNHIPAIGEMVALQQLGQKLVQRYGRYCTPMEAPA